MHGEAIRLYARTGLCGFCARSGARNKCSVLTVRSGIDGGGGCGLLLLRCFLA